MPPFVPLPSLLIYRFIIYREVKSSSWWQIFIISFFPSFLSTPLPFPLSINLFLPASLLTRHFPLCVWRLARVSVKCLSRSAGHCSTGERQNLCLLDEWLCSCFQWVESDHSWDGLRGMIVRMITTYDHYIWSPDTFAFAKFFTRYDHYVRSLHVIITAYDHYIWSLDKFTFISIVIPAHPYWNFSSSSFWLWCHINFVISQASSFLQDLFPTLKIVTVVLQLYIVAC